MATSAKTAKTSFTEGPLRRNLAGFLLLSHSKIIGRDFRSFKPGAGSAAVEIREPEIKDFPGRIALQRRLTVSRFALKILSLRHGQP